MTGATATFLLLLGLATTSLGEQTLTLTQENSRDILHYKLTHFSSSLPVYNSEATTGDSLTIRVNISLPSSRLNLQSHQV